VTGVREPAVRRRWNCRGTRWVRPRSSRRTPTSIGAPAAVAPTLNVLADQAAAACRHRRNWHDRYDTRCGCLLLNAHSSYLPSSNPLVFFSFVSFVFFLSVSFFSATSTTLSTRTPTTSSPLLHLPLPPSSFFRIISANRPLHRRCRQGCIVSPADADRLTSHEVADMDWSSGSLRPQPRVSANPCRGAAPDSVPG